ncbi:unnamed protein product [marine sediment metagenome]|uniref:Uncharacterized protein n=1 Tax=marine sediment metagenome TaxID=412755 RepID=X1LYF0_9ZZZZ
MKIDRTIAEDHLYIAVKHLTINGNAAQIFSNLFVVTGVVRVFYIYGIVETATLAADVTACYFDVFPTAGAAVELTKIVAAPAMSSFEVGSGIIKSQEAAQIATVLRANVAMFAEEDADFKKVAKPFILGKKSGAVTNVRFVYTTGTDLTEETGVIHFEAQWQPLSSDGALVPAA